MVTERAEERPQLGPGTVVRRLDKHGKPTNDYLMVTEVAGNNLTCIPVSWGSDGDDVLYQTVLVNVTPGQVAIQPNQRIAGGSKPNPEEIADILEVAASLKN